MQKFKIWVYHLLRKHKTGNMPTFISEKGNGWYCPYCDWKEWDIASCKLIEGVDNLNLG